MKILKISGAVVLTILISFLLLSGKVKDRPTVSDFPERSGTAILLTGAAARIPQEASLLEDLYNRGELKDVVFISGVSSGALNAVMLNGILSGKMSWADYKKILFSLKNSDIYLQNEKKRLPVNTEPARHLYTSIVEGRLGYHKIGDLPITTSISFTYLRDLDLRKTVYRMCSRKINEESDTTLSLVDIMLASSSFPIAFPPVRIRNVKTIPDVGYVDGGVGDDHVPFHALLEFEKSRGKGVSRVFIVSRKSDSIPEVSEELKVLGIDDNGKFDRMGISLDNILQRGMLKRLKAYSEQAPKMVDLSYVFVPDFNKDFLLFDFENLSEQYALTTKWAKTHKPVPLSEYLLNNGIRTK